MHEITINWWAISVCVIVNFIIGGIWYSPGLFIKPWLEMAKVNKNEFDSGLPKALVGDLISSFLIAFVLVHAIRYSGADDLAHGLMVSFWNWLGFVAAIQIGAVTYEHRPFKFFAITAGYRFVTMMISGAILTLWT